MSGLVFGLFVAANVLNIASVRSSRIEAGDVSDASNRPAVFHFGAIIPSSSRDPYYHAARASMVRTAAENQAAVQFFEYDATEGGAAAFPLLQMVADLELDGVILTLPDEPYLLPAVDAIDKAGTPVIALENDLPGSRRKAFVGSNDFQIGSECGRLADASCPPGTKAALVLSSRYADAKARKASFLMGFTQAIKSAGRVSVAFIVSTRSDALSGEEALREILDEHPDIGLIVFTAARDTAEGAQALIEFNRVGNPVAIGFDDTPEILEYVRSEVILATVARNPDRAGSECVTSLIALRKGARTNAYVDTGVDVVDRQAAREAK